MPFCKTIDSRLSTIDKKNGYTLIEFLIVIGILALSVGSILLLLTTTIKGANKSNINAEVKQNGQAVLDSLVGQIRSASDVSQLVGGQYFPTQGGQSGIFLTLSTGEKLTIVCFNADATHNGYIGAVKDPATATGPHLNYSDFANNALTNTDIKSGVDIVCTNSLSPPPSFVVSQSSSLGKTVAINFKAQQGIAAPSRVDFLANASFETAVVLRIYQ